MPDLHDLLTREADGLDVPAAPSADILARAKGVRRRRAALTAVAGVAAATVVGGGLFALTGGHHPNTAPDPAGSLGNAVYAVGNKVYLDGGANSVTIDDKAVKSLYYTSAGILVRQGDNASSDGGGPQRFSLITPDGSLRPVGVETEETVHATDPDQPYLAYAQNIGGTLTVYVHDVVMDQQVAAIEVRETRQRWFPVSIDGDHVYVEDGAKVYDVDWRTGRTTLSDVEFSAMDQFGGHAFNDRGDVIDVATGDVLLDLPDGSWGTISPDGTRVISHDQDSPDASATVYDLTSGSHTALPGDGYSWAWTPDSTPFSLTADGTLTTCAADGTACDTGHVALGLPATPEPSCYTKTIQQPGGGVATEEGCETPEPYLILGDTIEES